MKIEIKKYKWSHSFSFLIGLLNFETIKNSMILDKRFIKKIITKSNKKMHKFTVFADNKIIGGIRLTELEEPGSFIVGVIIFKKYQNKGISSLAIKKIIPIFKKMKIKKILIINEKTNTASVKLAKKFGAKIISTNKKEIFWEKKI